MAATTSSATPATGAVPANPSAPTNTAPSGTTATSGTTTVPPTTTNTTVNIHTSHSATGPGSITILERQVHDSSWPSDLILDLSKTNWLEWSHRLTLLADRLYVSGYLDGSLSCPDAVNHAAAHDIWSGNDKSLRAFMLERIAPEEYDIASPLGSAHATFVGLKTRHEQRGLHAQINLLRKSFEIHYKPGTPIRETSKELRKVFDRFTKMGKIDEDKLFTIIILNALGIHFPQLQSAIHSMTEDANFNSGIAMRRIDTEADLEERRAELGIQSSVFALTTSSKPKGADVICSNCKRLHHTIEYCVRPGGGMAGKTMDEAKAAQRAAAGKPPRVASGKSNSANVASAVTTTTTPAVSTPSTTPTAMSVSINGVSYILSPTPAPATAQITAAPPVQSSNFCDHTGTPLDVNDLVDYEAYLLDNGAPATSVDWNNHSKTINLPDIQVHTISGPETAKGNPSPFILDSGATCHISPERSDFKSLRSIPSSPIKGFEGTSISAIGIGTVVLSVGSNHQLTLENVLFVPAATVRLISVVALARDHQYITYFDPTSCYVATKDGSIIARGLISPTRNLYTLSTSDASPGQSALYASRIPDIETWHRRLGHCNTRTIVDMARTNVVKGMPINLSHAPPKCNECIIGKQARSSVPKVREGLKAERRLERVYVDLCGPMHVPSKTGRLYSMNIIDDFSGYVWSIRLRRKDEAALALRVWHHAVENQSGERLKKLITDNGELLSQTTQNWCAEHGIEHQLTAPHTSAQNGRVERLHRTLMDKSRTMRLACNTPPSLWDEFYATATYLTTLTTSSSCNGKTPFELWFGHAPSLSHLREIGCRAFALISTHNPKIYQRSVPCILIGYAPNAKAYCLWNPATGRIFNSFHVNFIEHLDSLPSDLLPGTLLNVGDQSLPPSWDSVLPTLIPPPPSSFEPLLPPRTSITVQTPSPLVPPPSLPTSNAPPPAPPLSSGPSNTIIPPAPPSPPRVPTTTSAPASPARPPTPASPEPPAPDVPSLRRTTRLRFPNSRLATRDGLAPDSRLAAALSDVATSAARRKEERSARQAELDDRAEALLSEFASVHDTHHLIPTDLDLADDPGTHYSVEMVLSAIADGSMEPILDSGDDPSWSEALASPDREYWIAGGRDELKSLKDLNVFVLVPRSKMPRGQKALKGKLVCKRKRDDAGNVVRYKVRYVAKGYAQRYGIDYDKTTAPTVRLESFRTILHIAATLKWDLQHVDVKTAFLHGVLPDTETMFMEQPPGFEAPGKETWVMKLMKSLYGMKQASRVWNQTFDKVVKKLGFERLACEWCVYRRESSTGTIIFAVHVDDIVSAASSPAENDLFKSQLKQHWEINDLGPAKFALGIAISRDDDAKTISISQSALIDRVVEQFGQSEAHSVDTPMVAGLQLRRPDRTVPTPSHIIEWAERTPYRSLVGSLMYIARGTRPDIAYAVSRLASYLDCYRPEHWQAAVRVLRYLKGTRDLQLTLGGQGPLQLVGYSDSDYANCPDSSRSVSGHCFTLGSAMISWSSRKQRIVADSSCYAEYIALHDSAREVIFLRQLLDGLHLLPSRATPVHCDNNAASILSEDHVFHARVKHIRVKYHVIREMVENGEVAVTRIRSSDNTADILTKPLARPDFLRLRHGLGLRGVEAQEERAF